MANINICDRCGAKIGSRRGLIRYKPELAKAKIDFSIFSYMFDVERKLKTYECDLCEDCSNKFVQFIEGTDTDSE